MTPSGGDSARRFVRCPICVDEYDWPDEPMVWLFDVPSNSYKAYDISELSHIKQADIVRRGYRKCPNPSKDTEAHYLPATYARYRDPLVIALVGAPSSGKTHLLTAMIRQAYRGGLGAYGISVSPLDFLRHEHFQRRFIEPFEKGGLLSATDFDLVEAADILLLRGPSGERAVTFFDVAGEDLQSTDALKRATRFLVGATAVIFVYPAEDPQETMRLEPASENRSFDLAVERLQGLPGGSRGLPVAYAVTKADRLRYVHPADRWLRRGDSQALDARLVRAESRDVYAYLHGIGAGASLRPFEAFTRCTLHFVSASGGDAVKSTANGKGPEGRFPRGVRPTRVLEPLVALLAMTGMITGPEAEKVGAP